MEKAAFYDDKFKYGNYEGPEAVVRKVAVGIIKNRIESKEKGRQKEKWINGKLVKTNFDKMPSPSSFGGGIAVKMDFAMKSLENDRPININKDDYENFPRNKKPFADFKMSELTYLNAPANKEYLK